MLDRIGTEITSGARPVGTVLTLEGIGVEYGVSRSVAREAVRVLESMGLLASRRRVGATVQPRTGWNLFDPRVVAWRLEGLAPGVYAFTFQAEGRSAVTLANRLIPAGSVELPLVTLTTGATTTPVIDPIPVFDGGAGGGDGATGGGNGTLGGGVGATGGGTSSAGGGDATGGGSSSAGGGGSVMQCGVWNIAQDRRED